MSLLTPRRLLLVAALLTTFALPVAALDKAGCGLVLLQEPGAGAALARKLGAVCAVRVVDFAPGPQRDLAGLARSLRRPVQELRQQGAQRVLVGGGGAAAHAAMAYAGSAGDVGGVLVLGPDADGADAAGLGSLAARLPQHAPVLWVVGSEDPQAKQGEALGFAKAPPHPDSRYVTVKADRKGTPDAAVRPALEWIKSLD